MSTTSATTRESREGQPAELPVLRWTCWPVGDHPSWSWLVVVGIVAVGALAGWIVADWTWGVVAAACVAASMWRFFTPITYEVGPPGLIQSTWRSQRRIPWSAVKSYAVRPTGIALFDRAEPNAIDVLRCQFLPAYDDQDELLCALREYLRHAAELER